MLSFAIILCFNYMFSSYEWLKTWNVLTLIYCKKKSVSIKISTSSLTNQLLFTPLLQLQRFRCQYPKILKMKDWSLNLDIIETIRNTKIVLFRCVDQIIYHDNHELHEKLKYRNFVNFSSYLQEKHFLWSEILLITFILVKNKEVRSNDTFVYNSRVIFNQLEGVVGLKIFDQISQFSFWGKMNPGGFDMRSLAKLRILRFSK